MKPDLHVAGLILAAVPLSAGPRPAVAAPWTTPRTVDGHPDLQGVWTTQTYTPLQRPERFAGREFLTDQEMLELTQLVTQDGFDPLAPGVLAATDDDRQKRGRQNDPTHYNNAVWLTTPQPKGLSSRRTSLIVDPPDGKLPPLTAAGSARLAARRAAAGFDGYENRPLQERCVAWTHEGPPMLPPPYNDLLQIFQTPGYVTVHRELTTNLPRIIPTDGRPHLTGRIRQWAGDSTGRWEGDTLVVDTANYNDQVGIQGSSATLHVVERFTRVSADRIMYQFTVDDPETWTRPWTAELPMMKADGRLFEYACHEGNYGMVNTLRGARVADQRSNNEPPPPAAR
jgi:hypothetical protein